MTERADQLHHDDVPAHSTALVQAFWVKHHITQFFSTLTAQIWLPVTSGFSQS
jgi:hypothetical protein